MNTARKAYEIIPTFIATLMLNSTRSMHAVSFCHPTTAATAAEAAINTDIMQYLLIVSWKPVYRLQPPTVKSCGPKNQSFGNNYSGKPQPIQTVFFSLRVNNVQEILSPWMDLREWSHKPLSKYKMAPYWISENVNISRLDVVICTKFGEKM